MPTPEILIELLQARRSFGSVRAVDGISLNVRGGEMFGLIGPDGAGKTTTLRLILGLLEPHEGRVLTCGIDPFRRRAELTHRAGYLSQRFSLYGDLSVDENVAFFAEVRGVRRWKDRRDDILGMLQLTSFRRRLADRLSGGMRQKLALACTLIHTPELLVLDEPTTGVDPVSRREFWKILARLQRDGLTVLLTTPYLDEAERCQRIGLMDHGRLLELDTPDRIRGSAGGRRAEVLARPRRRAQEWLRSQPAVAGIEAFGERLHLTLSESAGADSVEELRQGMLAQRIDVASIRPVAPSLEDAFIARLRAVATPGEEM